jgi:hypothetical protein
MPAAVRIVKAECDQHRPDFVVGSSKGMGNPLAEWHCDRIQFSQSTLAAIRRQIDQSAQETQKWQKALSKN